MATAAPIPADSVDFSDPKAVAAGYLAAWCPYAWTEPQSDRASRTAPFMTTDAAAALDADTTWWASVVVATRTVASCAVPAVYSALGPDDPTHRYLRLQTTRQVTTTTGSAAETVLEQRVLVLGGDGRWLVDARVQGG